MGAQINDGGIHCRHADKQKFQFPSHGFRSASENLLQVGQYHYEMISRKRAETYPANPNAIYPGGAGNSLSDGRAFKYTSETSRRDSVYTGMINIRLAR